MIMYTFIIERYTFLMIKDFFQFHQTSYANYCSRKTFVFHIGTSNVYCFSFQVAILNNQSNATQEIANSWFNFNNQVTTHFLN